MSKEELKQELNSLKAFEANGGLKILGFQAKQKFVARKVEVMERLLED